MKSEKNGRGEGEGSMMYIAYVLKKSKQGIVWHE